MRLLNPAITQTKSVRTNFILKCLVHTSWHLSSRKEVFPSFAGFWHGFVNWCQSVTRLKPCSYPYYQGPSEAVLQPTYAGLIKGNRLCTASTSLCGEGSQAGTKNRSPSRTEMEQEPNQSNMTPRAMSADQKTSSPIRALCLSRDHAVTELHLESHRVCAVWDLQERP